MWVMIREMPPTIPFPVKMGIYWAVPWADKDLVRKQRKYFAGEPSSFFLHLDSVTQKELEDEKLEIVGSDLDKDEVLLDPHNDYGMEPNMNLALKVSVGGEDVRLFAHEVSKVSPENMRAYVLGDEPTHVLQPDGVAEESILRMVRKGALREIYEAALLDGCSPGQASCVARGVDIETPDGEFPAVGWYRPHPDLLCTFCRSAEIARIEEHCPELLTMDNWE